MAFNSAARVKPEVDLYKEITEEEADVLDFFHAILKIQSKAYRASAMPFGGSAATLEKRLKMSQRLVRPEDVHIPRREYLNTLDEIQSEIEARWIPDKKFERISKLEELNAKNFPRFMRGMLSGRSSYLKGLPTKTGMRKATLQYALEYAASPFMARLSSDVVKKVDISSWQKGKCPVCGRLPVMARLKKEDGARFLYCGFCTTEWRFPRLTCVNCGNTDQFGMQYFFAEGDTGHRVDVCDKCKRSVRTTDERALGRETFFEVENWVTSYLNDVARRRGYKPIG